jgi:hypothetical protein
MINLDMKHKWVNLRDNQSQQKNLNMSDQEATNLDRKLKWVNSRGEQIQHEF